MFKKILDYLIRISGSDVNHNAYCEFLKAYKNKKEKVCKNCDFYGQSGRCDCLYMAFSNITDLHENQELVLKDVGLYPKEKFGCILFTPKQ